jgi:hypothetical protein
MASLQQLRYEALAADVERATRPFLLRLLTPQTQPVEARVERVDGSIVQFKLKEVVVDGAELVGWKTKRQAVVISLSDVKAIWRRRLHTRRTAAVCAATMAAGSAASVIWSSSPLGGAILGGAVLAMPVAALICVVLNQFKVLSEWTLLYDRDRQE